MASVQITGISNYTELGQITEALQYWISCTGQPADASAAFAPPVIRLTDEQLASGTQTDSPYDDMYLENGVLWCSGVGYPVVPIAAV